ncbi:MAG: T9SS type A sorting domain-containing protein [Bacteroidales bacterium]|nr:T9SS type A sorting domain-containing protein [Bacteroidales bacterium]
MKKIFLIIIVLIYGNLGFSQFAGDFCSTATYISSIDSVFGTTLASYTDHVSASDTIDEDQSPLGNVFCGSIENNSWFEFTASDTVLEFYVSVSNCSYGDGIQMEIYESFDCYNFSSVSNCENTGLMTDFTMVATGLIPGNNYFIMVDGQAGDVCDYNLTNNAIKQNYYNKGSYYKLFPNPANNFVNIEILDNRIFNIVIMDLPGKKIYERKIVKGDTQIELAGLKPGYYIIILQSDKTIFKEKIQIIR